MSFQELYSPNHDDYIVHDIEFDTATLYKTRALQLRRGDKTLHPAIYLNEHGKAILVENTSKKVGKELGFVRNDDCARFKELAEGTDHPNPHALKTYAFKTGYQVWVNLLLAKAKQNDCFQQVPA